MPCFQFRPSAAQDTVTGPRPVHSLDSPSTSPPRQPLISPSPTSSSSFSFPLENVTKSNPQRPKTATTTSPQLFALLTTTTTGYAGLPAAQPSVEQLPTLKKPSSHFSLRSHISHKSLKSRSSTPSPPPVDQVPTLKKSTSQFSLRSKASHKDTKSRPPVPSLPPAHQIPAPKKPTSQAPLPSETSRKDPTSRPPSPYPSSEEKLPPLKKYTSHLSLRSKVSHSTLKTRPSSSSMANSSTKSSARNFFHEKFQNHHPHLPRSSKSSDKNVKVNDKDPEYQKKKEEHKHFICQFEERNQKEPLSPSEITKDPSEKHIGQSSKYLKKQDFKLVKTIGTGTFARVWLAKLSQPQSGDEGKVFALKILRKVDIIKLKQIEHVRNERSVLAAVAGHPFITTMVASFHDQECLYMILDYCPGGEIFSYLRRYKTFEEPTACFYAAEVCLILEFLHEKEGVAYRDLKPENILIDADGHLKLVDFGFAKKLDGKQTWTLCGTPEYLAPETIRNTGHGNAVDWWAFGILIYEFLIGQPPFWDNNPMKLYEQIVKGKINYPTSMSADAKDLVNRLCEVDPSKRLGNLKGRASDVKNHAWFKDIDWTKLYKREMKGPIIPQLKGNDDTRNFENYDSETERRTIYTPDMKKKYDNLFECF